MPLIEYTKYRPSVFAQSLIGLSNTILVEYEQQGYHLTLRQLYYQLVSRDHIPNNLKSYNRLGDIVSRAREAGMIDWDRIEDRTRNVREFPHWNDGNHFLKDVSKQFSLDWWEGQPRRCFVFVEKEALEEVVGRAAAAYDVPYIANKGYLSASAVWDVAHNRMLKNKYGCDSYTVIHLGDHDPSGIDMTRDIRDRLMKFARRYKETQTEIDVRVVRIALNMEQIDEYNPPPNPAKATDSRFADYESKFGDESWELDALEPSVIDQLIRDEIVSCIDDMDLFDEQKAKEDSIRDRIMAITLKD